MKTLSKVNKDPFSNGEEYRWWTSRNCDKCIKKPRINFAGEFERKTRCAIFRDIELRMISYEPIAHRTIDICKMSSCPYKKEDYPIRKRKYKIKSAGLPQLFREDEL